MKKISIIIAAAFAILFTQCTPKAGDKAATSTDSMNKDFRSQPPTPTAAPRIEMGKYEKFTLPNGLQVIVVQNNKLPRVSFQLLVDAPPFLQGEPAGYVDFAGQLLNKGTKKHSKAELDEAVDFMGATLNTSASGIYAASLKKHSDKLLQLMSEVLLEPAFPEDEFEKLQKQTLSGLAASKDNPNAIASNVASVLRFGKGHPYGEIVTEKTVEKISLDLCKTYYNDYFRPNISYLAIVGDVSASEAKAMAEKYFSKWERKEIGKKRPDFPSFPKEATVDFVDKAGAVQSVISVTYPVDFAPNSPDRIPAVLMNAMLGGYFRSRINQNLRETRAYTYGAGSQLNFDRYVGYFNAGGSVRNEVTDSALQELLFEIERMRTEPIPDEELALVKSVISGQFARSLESPQTVANFALSVARYNLPADFYDTYLERIEKVTKEDIQLAARKYLQPGKAHILVVGNKDQVAGGLARFSTQKKVNYYDIYGSPVEDSDLKIPANLTAQGVIDNYIKAIGGRDKLRGVKTMSQTGEANLGGFNLVVETKHKQPGKMAMGITAQGQVVNSVVVNNGRVRVTQMGQSQFLEGDDAASSLDQAELFSELHYAGGKATVDIKAVEMIEGKKCYKLEVNKASGGLPIIQYYDADTGLKVREIASDKQGDQIVTQTVDYTDYKEVNGIMLPHTTKISGGAMPMPLTMKISRIEINTDIPDSIFRLD